LIPLISYHFVTNHVPLTHKSAAKVEPHAEQRRSKRMLEGRTIFVHAPGFAHEAKLEEQFRNEGAVRA
jgi:hypothetical protein